VRITDFVSSETYRQYLAAADISVQLRQNSRGETSAAVMDAMSYGLPLIANANGSFAEIDPDAVFLLPEAFEDADLVQALDQLYNDRERRKRMSQAALRCVQTNHTPALCASQYYAAIERAYPIKESVSPHTRRCLLDVTATQYSRLKSGIERVALALCKEFINSEPEFGVVTPVYLKKEDDRWVHYEATDLVGDVLDIPVHLRKERRIEPAEGDMLLTLDLAPEAFHEAAKQGLFAAYRQRNVKQFAIVYDLLPVRMPEVFPPGTDERHDQWLRVICSLDGALCISAHVADDLRNWRVEQKIESNHFHIGHFMLGADTGIFNQQGGRFKNPSHIPIKKLIKRHQLTFLMVGTIEPRKGYQEVLDTFEALWREGHDCRLIIVGREGWLGLHHDFRHNISHTVFRLKTHPERYRRLIWIGNADDRRLEEAYDQADCLIAASYDEGFGLPIIEAAQRGIPVIARDIPVFREVAPAGTTFFADGELGHTIAWWQQPKEQTFVPFHHTWQDSAHEVMAWLRACRDTLDAQFEELKPQPERREQPMTQVSK
jgi:glycosyltransferase involved in cell wall biosynthesis